MLIVVCGVTELQTAEVKSLKTVNDDDLCVLNTKQTTYIHPRNAYLTTIDLTISSPQIVTDFTWMVHDDQCGSDHYPLLITAIKHKTQNCMLRWNLPKADWQTFIELCKQQLTGCAIGKDCTIVDFFPKTLLDIASKTIPKTSTILKKPPKPWFDDSCNAAVKSR